MFEFVMTGCTEFSVVLGGWVGHQIVPGRTALTLQEIRIMKADYTEPCF